MWLWQVRADFHVRFRGNRTSSVRSVTSTGIPAAPGNRLNEGDVVSTGTDSWALLEMVDGATFTLRPDTQLRIDAYVYTESQISKNKSLLSLIRGAFRAVTGAIGTLNRPGYTITTPTATIGVRGTDHETAYYPAGAIEAGAEPGTYDKVNTGETYIRSERCESHFAGPHTDFAAHQRADRSPQVLASVPAFYRRHAQMDGPLAARVKALREKHQQKRLELHKERAKAKTEGREQRLENQRAHREQMQEQHRKKKTVEKEEKRQRSEKGERQINVPDRSRTQSCKLLG